MGINATHSAPDSLLGEFTKASDSRINDTSCTVVYVF